VRTLIFHPALAPYRVDLFNELATRMQLKVVFLNRNLVSQKLDQERLTRSLHCEHDFLCAGINIFGRQIRWGLAKTITGFKPDVVIGIEYSPTSLFIVLLKHLSRAQRWGFMVMTSDNIHMCSDVGLGRRLARSIVLNCVDGIVVYSQAVKSWYVDYGIQDRSIGVCSNIQREDRFRESCAQAQGIGNRILHDRQLSGKRVVLCIGRLAAAKGVERVMTAFAQAYASTPDSRLVIVGTGPQEARLHDMATELLPDGSIIFTGHLEGPELYAWYGIGQALVLGSHFEPYGAVVAEALMAGIPVLCSSVAGAADLIREWNGHLFDPHDVQTLAELLVMTLSEITPLQKTVPTSRPSLMPITFEDSVASFCQAVEYSATSARPTHNHSGWSRR